MSDSLVDTIRVVSVRDPAIDRVKTDLEKYERTRDPSLIAELPGQHVLWYALRPLSVADFMFIDSAPSDHLKVLRAFQQAVEYVDGFPVAGQQLRPTVPVRDTQGHERMVWELHDLEPIFRARGARTLYEIGRVAYERAAEGNE